jgi:sec-independent protein translocase protein TatB
MFDIGWSELMVIGVVAILAIGPKDLPLALKTVGQWVAKARALAREFQGSLDEMIREAELDKVKQEVQSAASSFDVTKEIEAAKTDMEKALEMPSIEMDPLAPPPEPAPETKTADPAPAPQPAVAEPKPEEKTAEAAPAGPPPAEPQKARAAGGQG